MKIVMMRVAAVVLIIAVLLGFQRLVEPKYVSELIEGSYTGEYYAEKEDHQVLMVGDCELYENFSPLTLWKNYGITSYIRGNAQQLAWHSYYLLKEALDRGAKPEVVVFSVLALKDDRPQKEEYNRLIFDSMKLSPVKLAALRASMMPWDYGSLTDTEVKEGEHLVDYLFPILRYHSRITDLSKEDLQYYFKNKQNAISGYYMRADVLPADEETMKTLGISKKESEEEQKELTEEEKELTEEEKEFLAEQEEFAELTGDTEVVTEEVNIRQTSDEPLGRHAMEYLDRIRELCEKKNIPLVLLKAPSLEPVWQPQWEEEIKTYSEKYNLDYINMLADYAKVGIDFTKDTYDGGLHMNVYGAEKCADYLGRFLREKYGLEDRRKNKSSAEIWKNKEARYEAKKRDQLEQVKRYGKVIEP